MDIHMAKKLQTMIDVTHSVLGELVSELASEYRIGEMIFWKIVYQKTKQVFQRLKEENNNGYMDF